MARDKTWWEESDDKVHEGVFESVKFLADNQTYVSNRNLLHMQLYGNTDYIGFQGRDYTRSGQDFHKRPRVSLNVIKSMCDTVLAKVAKNKPKPQILTKGGNWNDQQRAKKLGKFLEGVFHAASVYECGAKVFLDTCIFGKGIAKVYTDNNEVMVERVFPEEIVIDDEEARYGAPRQMHQRKVISKDCLIALFPDKERIIMQADSQQSSLGGASIFPSAVHHAHESSFATVVESWHLPSGPESGDGKRSITIENGTLMVEEWDKQQFPFAFMEWGPAVLGFWPIGLAEELTPIQREINVIMRRIQESQRRVAIPRIYLDAASKVPGSHLTNEIGTIVRYQGNPPIIDTPPAMSADVYSHLDRLYQRAFEIAGVSQLSASSQKPAGLNSGVALREFLDNETERFSQKVQGYESFFLDVGRLAIDLARDVQESGEEISVNVKGKDFIDSIKWSEVDLSEDKYIMQTWPTNLLSQTPAAKKEEVIELLQSQLITPEQGRALLPYPDTEGVFNLENAPIEDIKSMITNMLDKGIYEPPEPMQDRKLAGKMVLNAYLHAKRQGAPENRLELLRIWLEDLKLQIEQEEAQLAAEQAALQPEQPAGPEQQPQPGLGPEAAGLPPEPGLEALPPEQIGAV